MSLAALFWAAILGVSASLTAGDMPTSMLRAMRDLNLPAPLMRPRVAWGHLLAQIILVVGLIAAPRPVSWVFTAGGVLLACVYLFAVWRARGHVCRCLSRRPHRIGPATIFRNASLLVLAFLSLGSGGVTEISASEWPALIPAGAAAAAEIVARRSPTA